MNPAEQSGSVRPSPPGRTDPADPPGGGGLPRGFLVAYVPAGDPRGAALEHLDDYVSAGVDVLEVGIPSPDPYDDGPVVASSMQRALADGFAVDRWARELSAWRAGRTEPRIVWMGYPDSQLGRVADHLDRDALDGLLIVDAHRRPDHRHLRRLVQDRPLGWCTFVGWRAPMPPAPLHPHRSGYTMVQARPGRTGVDALDAGPPGGSSGRHVHDEVQRVRTFGLGAPIAAGFGIRTPAHVRRVAAAGADGCVVGTAVVDRLVRRPDTLAAYLRGLRAATEAFAAAPGPEVRPC